MKVRLLPLGAAANNIFYFLLGAGVFVLADHLDINTAGASPDYFRPGVTLIAAGGILLSRLRISR